ncbi:choice-of-anchor J domain-containing protein [Halocola ammonii]
MNCDPFELPVDLTLLIDEEPNCWETFYGGYPEIGPSYNSYTDWDFVWSGSSPAYCLSIDQTGVNDWSFSPSIQVPNEPSEILFEFRMSLHDSQYPYWPIGAGDLDGNDEVQLLITTDEGENFETLASWTESSEFVLGWEDYKLSLNDYQGQEIQIVFWATDGEIAADTVENTVCFKNVIVRQSPECPTPEDLSVSYITNNSAKISWTPSDTASVSVVQYGPVGFNPDSLEGESFSTSESQNVLISDLSEETVYHVYVKADCENSFESEWIGPLEFTTNCEFGGADVVFCEGFETGVPGSMTHVMVEGYSSWIAVENSNLPNFYPYDGQFSASFGGASDYIAALESPTFDGLGGGSLQLSFNHTNTRNYWNETNAFAIEVSNDDGASWIPVDSINELLIYEWELAIYNLDDFITPSETMKVRFIATGVSSSQTMLDNIFVSRTDCIESDNLDIGHPDYDSIEMSYLPEEDTNWSIVYGPEGFDPAVDSGTTINPILSNIATLENLEQSTDYSVYYQKNCEGVESNSWSGPINFSTLCEPVTVGFTENFEESLPSCWREGENGNLNNGPEHLMFSKWNHTSSNGHGQEASISQNDEGSNWLLSPFIDLSGGDYQAEFHLEVFETNINSAQRLSEGDTLQFLVSLEGSENWVSLGHINHTYISPIGGEVITVDLSSYTGNVLEFAFRVVSDDYEDPEVYSYKIKLSSFEITNVPTCPNPEDLTLINYTDSTASISWLPTGEEAQWNLRYGEPGFEPTENEGTLIDVADDPTTEISDLSSSTIYEVYVQAECIEGEDLSEWVGPIELHTSCSTITPEYLEGFGIGPQAEFPECWQQATGTLEHPIDWGSSDWDLNTLNSAGIEPNTLISVFDEYNKVNWAISPSIHLSSESLYQLDFVLLLLDINGPYADPHYITGNNTLRCMISGDNGETWDLLRLWDNSYQSQHGAEILNFDLSEYQGDTVRIAFLSEENGGSPTQVRIDNFHVHELNCLAPTSIGTSSVEWDSAQVSWMPEGDETAWNIQVVEEGQDPELNNGDIYNVESDTTFTVSNLQPTTDYQVYVQAVCGAEDNSPWLNSNYFTTPVSCPAPSNLTLESFTEEHMEVSWTPGGEESNWEVLIASGYFNPDDDFFQTVETTSNSNVLIEPNYTQYDYYSIYVRAVCDWNGDEVSEVSQRIEAAINYPALAPDYFNDFQGEPDSVFQYWREADWGIPSEGPVGFNSDNVPWFLGNNYAEEESDISIKKYMSSGTDEATEDWLLSPLFELSPDTEYEVEFDISFVEQDFFGMSPGGPAIVDDFNFMISDDYGATWDTLGIWAYAYESPYGGEHVTFSLEDYAGSTVQMAFWANRSFLGASADIIVYIDDFELGATPVCLPPSEITLENITPDAANISWVENNSAQTWNIRYGEPGFDPETSEGQIVYADSNNDFLLNSLEDTTTYEVYVRSMCSEDNLVSTYAGPVTFTTTYQVGSQDLPWDDGFDDLEIPDLPDGWSVGDENGDSLTWQSDDQFRMVGATGLYISGSPDQPLDDWIFTPQLQLEEDLSYALSFYYQGGGEGIEENLEVLYGGMAEAEGMEIELIDLQGISNTEYQLALVNFSVDADGLYFIGFHGYSDAGSAYIAIDDVRLDVCMANAEFSYDTDTLCTDDGVVIPSIEMVGGTFTAQAGLDINTQTGEIDPSNSEIGSYDVSYFIEEDSLCFDGQTNTIIIDACAGLEEYSESSSVRVYPNPAEDIIRVDLRNIHFTSDVKLELLDVAGKVLKTERVDKPVVVVLEIEDVNTGLYLIRISTGEQVITRRIVVNK